MPMVMMSGWIAADALHKDGIGDQAARLATGGDDATAAPLAA